MVLGGGAFFYERGTPVLNLPVVPLVFAPGLILVRERQRVDFFVFQSAKLTQLFGGIDFNPVSSSALLLSSLELEFSGTNHVPRVGRS